MNETQNEMVFTMGLPGAGKSTALTQLGLTDTHYTIDPDTHKQAHPDYDPKQPELLHAWSSQQAEKEFLAACATGEGLYIVDGTGTNSDKMVRRIRQAQSMGFVTRLVYVRVALKTAIYRNANRERVVPEEIVREKSLDITTSFDIVSSVVDVVQVIDND